KRGLMPEDRAQQDQQDRGQREHEDDGLPLPEEGPDLQSAPGQAGPDGTREANRLAADRRGGGYDRTRGHRSAPISSRYTSSRLGRIMARRGTSPPNCAARPVTPCVGVAVCTVRLPSGASQLTRASCVARPPSAAGSPRATIRPLASTA